MRKAIALAVALAFALPLAALAPGATASLTPQAAVPVTELTSWANNGTIDDVSYSPDGKHLAIAIDGGPVQILNATSLAFEINITTQPNWIAVSSISWGPNSDKVGVGYEGGAVSVWRIPGGTNAWAKSGLNYDVRGVAWSPDGKFLAAGIVHSVLIFWGENGYLNATIPLDYGGSQPAGLSWSHDSDFIAVGQQALSPSGAIVALFDAKSWGKSLGWRWVGPDMDNVAFEGRGRFLAVQLGGSRAEVWEVRNWTLFANLSTTSGLENFAWTADGSRMVTLETEPSARPNQTEDLVGFEVLHLGGGSGNSSALAISPDGRTVAVGYLDGTVRLLSVGGERLFEDLTPLTATTGDPLTFTVRSTGASTVHVDYSDAFGGRAGSGDLVFAAGRHTLTITVPPDWEGTMLYALSQPGNGITAPQRIVRVSDNDAPTVTACTFTRTGSRGEFGTATATVTDNVRLGTASMLLAIDGTASAAATAGANKTLTFSLTAAISEENETVRIEVRGTDVTGNGGSLCMTVIDLADLGAPQFGADLSQPGTAGGRILLGTVATDARGAPTVRVTWRELAVNSEGPWSDFTFGAPPPGLSSFSTTFPLSHNTVAVEYAFNASDAAGNSVETPTRVQPVLDREPPELVADLSDRQAAQGDRFHLGLIARDNIAVTGALAQVQEDGGVTVEVLLTPWPEYGKGAFEANITVGAEAQVVAYLFVITDTEGNTANSGRRQLSVLDNDPPVIRIIEPVLRATAGADFTFHVETSDRSDVRNLTVYFRHAGETSFLQEEFVPDSRGGAVVKTARFGISLTELGLTTAHDGRAIEVYFYTIDGALNGGTLGSASAPLTISVLDGAPPVARIEAAGDYIVGSSVALDASGSEDDLGIVEYLWTIDDHPAGNHSNVAWRVDSAGQHTVKLTVKDAANNSQTQTLRITATEPAVASAPVGSTIIWIVVGAAVAGAAVVLVMRMRKPKKPDEE
jgi:WD40 repeat protein